MTYPQPDSVKPVLAGQQYFRLKTPLSTPGDIYESKVGALGFALGPQSDLATVLISYLDSNAPTGVSQAVISPDRNLVGRIDARNDAFYPGVGSRKGRILISPGDIYSTRWRPDAFDANDVIEFETPYLDVIQYFIDAPSVSPQRSDRIFRYQYLSIPVAGNSSWLVLPAYGRKSGYFTFLNRDGINTVTVNVMGVKLSISGAPAPEGAFQQQLFTDPLITGDSAVYNFQSSTDGLWDYLAIEFSNYAGAAMPTTVQLSDDDL